MGMSCFAGGGRLFTLVAWQLVHGSSCKSPIKSKGPVLLQVLAHQARAPEYPSGSPEVLSVLELEALLSAKAASQNALSPVEEAAISNITRSLQQVTLPALNESHTKDLHELHLMAGVAGACNAALDIARNGSEGIDVLNSTVRGLRAAHLQCREREALLKVVNDTQWEAFANFLDALEPPGIAIPTPRRYSPEMDAYFEENAFASWLHQHREQYRFLRETALNASRHYWNASQACEAAQQTFEESVCVYAFAVNTAAGQYQQCYAHANASFLEAWVEVGMAVKGRKATFRAVSKILCYAELLHLNATQQGRKLDECASLESDAGFLTITPPSLPIMHGLSSVQLMPGDDEWERLEYGSLPAGVRASPTSHCRPSTTTWTSTPAANATVTSSVRTSTTSTETVPPTASTTATATTAKPTTAPTTTGDTSTTTLATIVAATTSSATTATITANTTASRTTSITASSTRMTITAIATTSTTTVTYTTEATTPTPPPAPPPAPPPSPPACVEQGGSCAATSDCCGAPPAECRDFGDENVHNFICFLADGD
eukprot:TRINITY_DN5044_c0_g1_i1.p1 TRINITY_DN5044_c0_g1~~TRINITY_DN5044_c0_g1_i1.p1  ORF type:complete len:547 (+),score=99.25 TRINITY_DN5044_c0_g1_i1:88-1728(+)